MSCVCTDELPAYFIAYNLLESIISLGLVNAGSLAESSN